MIHIRTLLRQGKALTAVSRATSGLVLRFTWEQVMHQPDWVREQIQAAVALRQLQTGCCLPTDYQPVAV